MAHDSILFLCVILITLAIEQEREGETYWLGL